MTLTEILHSHLRKLERARLRAEFKLRRQGEHPIDVEEVLFELDRSIRSSASSGELEDLTRARSVIARLRDAGQSQRSLVVALHRRWSQDAEFRELFKGQAPDDLVTQIGHALSGLSIAIQAQLPPTASRRDARLVVDWDTASAAWDAGPGTPFSLRELLLASAVTDGDFRGGEAVWVAEHLYDELRQDRSLLPSFRAGETATDMRWVPAAGTPGQASGRPAGDGLPSKADGDVQRSLPDVHPILEDIQFESALLYRIDPRQSEKALSKLVDAIKEAGGQGAVLQFAQEIHGQVSVNR